MNTTHKTRSAAKTSTLRLLRRTASAAAVVAVVAAAVAVPITAPEPTPGSAPMVIAIARADCPPDCGPGGGGTPSGPPGGGTEFVPPSMQSMPAYEPGRGQPPMDQNNGISIYNSATPQPSQAAQPSQAPAQNQDGSYNRAANGEQQPINHDAPSNQGINQDWQNLSNRLNQQAEGQSGQQQSGQDNPRTDHAQNEQQDTDQTCESIVASLSQRFSDLFEYTEEELAEARQKQEEVNRENEENQRNGRPLVAQPRPAYFSQEHIDLISKYNTEFTAAEEAAGLSGQCSESNKSGATPAASEVELEENKVASNEQFKANLPCDKLPRGPIRGLCVLANNTEVYCDPVENDPQCANQIPVCLPREYAPPWFGDDPIDAQRQRYIDLGNEFILKNHGEIWKRRITVELTNRKRREIADAKRNAPAGTYIPNVVDPGHAPDTFWEGMHDDERPIFPMDSSLNKSIGGQSGRFPEMYRGTLFVRGVWGATQSNGNTRCLVTVPLIPN